MNFEVGGKASKVEAEGISEEIRQAFVGSRKYTVVDRTLTRKVMQEWETQQSGVTDEERAITVGKLFNVQVIITGKLLRFPAGGWQISAVVLDAQTGVTKKAETVRHKGDFFTLLDQKVPKMAKILAGFKIHDPANSIPEDPYFPVGVFIVNLDEGKRYLKINVELRLNNQHTKTYLEKRKATIKDLAIAILQSLNVQGIRSVAGRNNLKQRLKSRIESLLPKNAQFWTNPPPIKEVLFTEFYLQ